MKSVSEWIKNLEGLTTVGLPPTLDRVRTVAQRMGLLPVPYKTILVTGTNGKGSVTTACEQLLKSHGYRVGAFTSPHLLRFNERIRVDGQMIADEELVEAFEAVAHFQNDLALNYFQYTFLAALTYFQKKSLEFAVLEIGIGGRLDAVNVIDGDVAVITNIGLDHQAILGNTHEAIAREKSGIFRPYQPAVTAEVHTLKTLQQVANQIKTPLYCIDQDYSYTLHPKSFDWHWHNADSKVEESTHLKDEFKELIRPKIDVSNAALALCALKLSGIALQKNSIQNGLQNIDLRGRLEVINEHCPIIMDVSHNLESCQHLAKFLTQNPIVGATHAVFSGLSDKNIEGMMAALQGHVIWHLAELKTPRAADLSTLKNASKSYQAYFYSDIVQAYEGALQSTRSFDRIVVFGSFYTVAEILKHRELTQDTPKT